MINSISVVLAIPATIIYKLITNSPLPALAGRLTIDTCSRFLSGDATLDADLVQDLQIARVVTPIVASFVLFEVVLLTFAIEEVTAGGTVDVSPLNNLSISANASQVKPGIMVATPPDIGTLILTGVGSFCTWPTTYSHNVALHS